MATKFTGSDTGKAGLEVKKTTGTPDVKGVTEIQLDTNLTLLDNGNGGVTIQSSGGGGGSGVTSVGLTETGSALTITNSPITTSGDINIAGAGTSSQVILGDLSLGTFTDGTVTSVGLTETGSALTITNSPITTSGDINIAGAGSSSQVILGDLSLGIFTDGTVTSVGLTGGGSALTITNTPITTSGDINIAGAGLPSQVILGNLGLGTLPTPANPSATIGATANNGTATTTFMRSDATPALETTGVTNGTYGSSTTVGQFTVDATGRITAATNVSISGGGGGGGYPLFKHDEAPTTTNFDPFRLWPDGASIELGVSSGGEGADADVSVFTPATALVGTPSLATITGIGNEATNTGREYVFYGDDYKKNSVQYRGGAATQTYPGKTNPPLYFVNSMREVVLPPTVFTGNSNLVIFAATTDAGENPYPTTGSGVNCVRVIDAGTHLVSNGSVDGGTNVPGGGEPPEEPTPVRILLIDDAPPAIFNGTLGVNYGLVPSVIV